MRKYIKPSYEMDCIKTEDIILTSMNVTSVGVATLGTITGDKANVSTNFEDLLLGLR